MSVNNINDLLSIVNELSYEEAVQLTKNLPAPVSLTEKKQLLLINKRIASLKSLQVKEKTIAQLNLHITEIRKLLNDIRNVTTSVQRLTLLQQAEEQKQLTEALIYTLDQYKDLMSQKLVADCKRVIEEYNEELRQTFISVKRDEKVFSSKQRNTQVDSIVVPIAPLTVSQKFKYYMNRILHCGCNMDDSRQQSTIKRTQQ